MARPDPNAADAELIRLARRGDVRAFEQLIGRYFDMVHSIAYVRMRHRQTAEDLAQEVFLRVFLHLGGIRDPGHFSAWVAQVTRNLAFHWQRKERRRSSLVAMVPLGSLAPDLPGARRSRDGCRSTV